MEDTTTDAACAAGITYDVIVVGAGLAGLNAAWDMQRAGLKVRVLEARDRVGGRTLTETHQYNGKESHFDLGAHFIGHEIYQSRIWTLVQDLGLEVFKQYDGPDTPTWQPGSSDPFWAGQGANLQTIGNAKPAAYIGGTIPPSDAGQHYLVYLDQLIDSVPVSAPHRMPNSKAYDAMSVWDWVTSIDLPGLGKAPDTFQGLTRMLCRVGFSAEPEDINMMWLLFYIKSSGGLQRFQALRWPMQGAQGFRLVEGAQSISEAIKAKLLAVDPTSVSEGAEVTAITDSGAGGCTVTTAVGWKGRAKKVLVAMAPKLCVNIAFSPPLPAGRISAAAHMPNSSMIMTYVTFTSDFWRSDTTSYPTGTVNGIPTPNISQYGLSGDALLTKGPVVWVMDNTSHENQPALFAFIVGDEAVKLRQQTVQQREAAVLGVLTGLFGPDVSANNPKYYEKDWNLDKWSEGCPAAHFEPGYFIDHVDDVLLSGLGPAPFGNVYFASTEAATVSNGYMDGAVWAGQEVAVQIQNSLGANIGGVTAPVAQAEEMQWCVETILSAIQQQNPPLEFGTLAPHMVFHGPGGKNLGSGPFTGESGTVMFYEVLGEHFTISQINIEDITVSVEHNAAFAVWSASGIVNNNGNPFRDMKGAMVFEFTPPDSPDALVTTEWLFMDVALVDAMVGAGPFAAQAAADGVVSTETPSTEQVEMLDPSADWTTGSLGAAVSASTGVDSTASLFAKTIFYGPGGTAIPRGPYFGLPGVVKFNATLNATVSSFLSLYSAISDDKTMVYEVQQIMGTTAGGAPFNERAVFVNRQRLSPAFEFVEMRLFANGLALD